MYYCILYGGIIEYRYFVCKDFYQGLRFSARVTGTLVVLMYCDWCKSRMRLVVIVECDWLVECSLLG
jgi:hypothetical protein